MTVLELETEVGKPIKNVKTFFVKGTFESMYAAQGFLKKNGYSYGSTSVSNPVAAMKGKYLLPQKWHNITELGRKQIDAVMVSDDFREGEVSVIIFDTTIQNN